MQGLPAQQQDPAPQQQQQHVEEIELELEEEADHIELPQIQADPAKQQPLAEPQEEDDDEFADIIKEQELRLEAKREEGGGSGRTAPRGRLGEYSEEGKQV